jgi:S-DNA-T family DNA segregation ATPase FtsK/SpoIIIE
VLGLFTEEDVAPEELAALLDKAGSDPVAVLMDDAEIFRNCSAAEELRAIINGVGSLPHALVLGGAADGMCSGFSGWQVEAKRARQGALLSPQNTGDGDLIGVRLGRSAVTSTVTPGRALLHLGDGQPLTVQVPWG